MNCFQEERERVRRNKGRTRGKKEWVLGVYGKRLRSKDRNKEENEEREEREPKREERKRKEKTNSINEKGEWSGMGYKGRED